MRAYKKIYNALNNDLSTSVLLNRAKLTFSLSISGVPLIFPIIGVSWGGSNYASPKT